MKFWEKIKNEPIIFMFRKMWEFSGNDKTKIVVSTILGIISWSMDLLSPVLLGVILNNIQKNGVNDENIFHILFLTSLFIVIQIVFWILHGPARHWNMEYTFNVKKRYKLSLIRITLNKNLDWHSENESGKSIDKIQKASEALSSFSRDISGKLSSIIVGTIGVIIAISFFNIWLSIIMLLGMFFPLLIMNRFDKKIIPLEDKNNIYDNKISATVYDYISNIVSVLILNIKEIVIKNIEKKLEDPKKNFLRTSIIYRLKWFSMTIVSEFFITIPLMIYIYYNYSNNIIIEIGTLAILYSYLSNLVHEMYNLADYNQRIIQQKVDIENAEEIESSFSQNTKTKKKEIVGWKEINIKDLNFKYDSIDEDVLHLNKIELNIKRGEKIAFIGKSGSGKTTFLKVIHGLYKNVSSKISFKDKSGDSEWENTNFEDLDLRTMLVPQEPELFSSSIRENVTFGLDYSDEDINRVLSLSEFSEVLSSLPKGLDSVVNEKGVNLSGGQKQRLALARALLFSNEKKIILLDESTSSVDPESEVKIYKNIFREFSGKTFLASIHKMNLLKYFDRIVIFENGKIIDKGSFEELYGRNNDFRRQWDEYVEEG